MMNATLIKGLAVGDVVEWGNLFPGMADEPALWQLMKVPGDGTRTYKFCVTWHGAHVGHYYAKIQKGDSVTWVKS